jgi:hypothetical protein
MKDKKFDCPEGYKWASTQEYLDIVSTLPTGSYEHPYYGQGGWNGYSWNGKDRRSFVFSDTAVTKKWKHSGIATPVFERLNDDVVQYFAGIICIKIK